MANVVVVGAQWGDEGKGKIVDWLSEQADVVVRFQGGHNAGHTLVIGGTVYKLSLLPSGVVRPGKLGVIGNGVVLDPHALVAEVERLAEQGVAITRENLRVAENATLILSLHRELDALREGANSGTKIGTTKRGIGPAYEDKAGRRAIRLMDLADLKTLPDKIERLLVHHNALRRGMGLDEFDPKAIYDELASVAPKVLPYMDAVWRLLDEHRRAGRRILFEGAQGRASRCGPRHLSLRDLVEHRWRARPRRAPASARARSATCSASPRPTRRAWGGAVPLRTLRRDRRAHRPARPRIRHRDGPQAPLRLVRRHPRAPDRADIGHRRHRAHQARRARRLRDHQGLRRLPPRWPDDRPLLRPRQGPRRGVEPIYEEIEGWGESTAGARSWASCRRRPSSTCAGSRNLSARPSLSCRQAPSATTPSWCTTRSRVDAARRALIAS
jgi:hypothetical protein